MRKNDLEFRRNGQSRDNRNPEIIAWDTLSEGQEYCYTLLWYEKDSEGWYIKFVGARPLECEFKGDIMKMMKYGSDVLRAEYELMDER